MKLLPDQCDDLLDIASLPPTTHTELNYRTRPLSPESEVRLTLLMLLAVPAILVSLAAAGSHLLALHARIEFGFVALAMGMAVWLVVRPPGSELRGDLLRQVRS